MNKISVCIPTYNGSQYLKACLDSVLNQTYSDIEILIVDDASTDTTVEILERYAAIDDRIKLFRNKNNLGLVGNWNQCVDLATGKWIKFLFQDDWIEPTCLEKMVLVGEKAASSLVVCQRDFVFENSSEIIREEYQKFLLKYSPNGVFSGQEYISSEDFCKAIFSNMAINYIGEPTAVLIRRDAFDKIGKFDSEFIQLCDLELFLRIGVSYGMSYVPETLAFFRVHQSSTTSLNSNSKIFFKDIIDPLLLRMRFCFSPAYKPLRDIDIKVGFGLLRDFTEKLRFEQLWGKYRHDPKWGDVIHKYPQFKLPTYLRFKRLAKKLLSR